jgi:hypothetical protein
VRMTSINERKNNLPLFSTGCPRKKLRNLLVT